MISGEMEVNSIVQICVILEAKSGDEILHFLLWLDFFRMTTGFSFHKHPALGSQRFIFV